MEDPVRAPTLCRDEFARRGFVVLRTPLISRAYCELLNARLEKLLRGEYDAGGAPDKAPKFRAEARTKPGKTPPPLGGPSSRTLQVINCWKADTAFAALVRSPTLGRAVAEVMGWRGARVANDQAWGKPPGAAALTFHRDSPYFDFVPAAVATVWIALDDMTEELGPLEYIVGSHAWGDGRVGSAEHFFDSRDPMALLHDAARREGIAEPEASLVVERLDVNAGGGGIHDGRVWHGSGRNRSRTQPRRGLGIHFVPADARFRDAENGYATLAHRFRDPSGGNALSDQAFPVTWTDGVKV
jgi:ectoine hydroxylase-related dioxygenase (phytanoyl-CoA dioxygenase family)